MRLGATLVHLSDAPPFPVARWADRLVAAGFESLWTPHIIGRGSLVPDPFVTLATAAAATRDVELGTATVQVPLYHPADLAHRVLSLMAACGGRRRGRHRGGRCRPRPRGRGDPQSRPGPDRTYRQPVTGQPELAAAQPVRPTIRSTSTRANGWSWYCG